MKGKKINKHQPIKLWGAYTSTIFSIALVLFVLGLLMVLGFHSYRYTNEIKENILYNVILTPDAEEHEILALKQTLEKKELYPYIKSVNYISKEEAAKNFTTDLGEDFVNFLGYNPLFPSLEVNLVSDIISENSTKNLEIFIKSVKSRPNVTDVIYQEVTINEVNNIFYKLAWFLVLFTALLLFISIILINNTIQIAIYAKRYTVKTMQLVGAKRSFIIRPFLKRSIFYGLCGGLIALLFLGSLVFIINNQFNANINLIENKTPYLIIGGIILGVGVVISLASTYFSINYYLNRKNEHLY